MLTERLKGKKVLVDGEVKEEHSGMVAEGYDILDRHIRTLVKRMRAQTMTGETPSEVEAFVMKRLEEIEMEVWSMSEEAFMMSLVDEIFETLKGMIERD